MLQMSGCIESFAANWWIRELIVVHHQALVIVIIMENTFITLPIQWKKNVLDKYEEKRYYSSKHLNLIAFLKILQVHIALEAIWEGPAWEERTGFVNE